MRRRWTASLVILALCVIAAGARTTSDAVNDTSNDSSNNTANVATPEPPTPSMYASLTATTLVVTADVSSDTHADALEQALDRHFPDHRTELYWRVGVGNADWQLLTLAAADVLAETSVSRLQLGPSGTAIEGLRPAGGLFDVRLARLVAVGGEGFASQVSVYEARNVSDSERLADACSTMFRSIKGEPIRFFSGTADLRPSSFALLDRYAEFAGDCPATRLAVHGHTDATGEDAFNLYLSEQRAAKVADYLVTAGIAPDRVARSGKGSSEPVADNGTAWGRSQNRRIEILLLPR